MRTTFMLAVMMWGMGCSVGIASSEAPRQFRIDAAESRVWFDADARLHSFRGETQQLTGRFTLLRTSPLAIADAWVSVEATRLETGHPERDADMRRDFLEVERFPTIEFHVDKLLTPSPVAGVTSWDLVLQGRLTIHGVTRDIRVPTTVSIAEERLIAQGRIHLNMRDYNIRVPRLFLIPMKSEVLVGFEVVARPVT